MMAPSIEMIAESLKHCSLRRRRSPSPPPLPEEEDEQGDFSDESGGGVTVELDSSAALPCCWEQCLDIRSGEMYYINQKTGERTSEDPRNPKPYCYYSSSSVSPDRATSSDDEDDTRDTACSSLSSCSGNSTSTADDPPPVLVAAGCKACFMYFMVPKRVAGCPRCSGALLHLGRNGCF